MRGEDPRDHEEQGRRLPQRCREPGEADREDGDAEERAREATREMLARRRETKRALETSLRSFHSLRLKRGLAVCK